MSAVHRKQVDIGKEFTAPKNLTLGFQTAREAFSVWYASDDKTEWKYIVLPTGQEFECSLELLQTVCIDGFNVFHLCRL